MSMSSSLAIKESPPSFILCFVLCNLFPSSPCFIFSVATRSDQRNPPRRSLHRSPLQLRRFITIRSPVWSCRDLRGRFELLR
ncbi:unnamed protein product [Brassica oleracea]